MSLCVALVGCLAEGQGTETLAYGEYRLLSAEEREVLIAQLRFEDQIQAYLVLMSERHPPDLGLAYRIAPGAEGLARAAAARLGHAANDIERNDLIFLLAAIHDSGYWDLRKEPELVPLMRRQATAIENEATRAINVEVVDRIESAGVKRK